MIYKNITRAEYNKLDGINASSLKPYYESAMQGNYEASIPRKETDAMRFGTMAHSLILEPFEFPKIYEPMPDTAPINPQTNKNYGTDTKKYLEWLANLDPSKIYYTQEQYDLLERIETNISNNKPAQKILNLCPNRETAVSWVDDRTGHKCKALIDGLGPKIAMDLKTIKEIPLRFKKEQTEDAIRFELIKSRNLLQFAFYFDGCLANGLGIEKFAVVFAENNSACNVAAAILSDKTLDIGRNMYERALDNYINRDSNKSAFEELLEV